MIKFSHEFGMQLVYFKGGGGSSGDVDFPDYMKTFHGRALDGSGADTPTSSIVDIINASLGNSPFAAATAYDPDTDITAYEAAISGFDTLIAGIDEATDWAALFTQAETSIDGVSDDDIDDDVDAFADELDDEITTKVLPRFEAGMRDINAVVSSAFVIGRANIEGFRDRDVARHASKLRLGVVADRQKSYVMATEQMLRLLIARYGWEESYMRTVIEAKRIKIVAKKEEVDENLKIGEDDATWDLELYQYGANLLASIGSGTMVPKTNKPSRTSSVIGGAMAGATAGSMVSPGWGTAIGAVVGAAAAYYSY